jgi:hypothetical protein
MGSSFFRPPPEQEFRKFATSVTSCTLPQPGRVHDGFVFSSPPPHANKNSENSRHLSPPAPSPSREGRTNGFVFSSPSPTPEQESRKFATSVTARRPPSHLLHPPPAWKACTNGFVFSSPHPLPNKNPKIRDICHPVLDKATTRPPQKRRFANGTYFMNPLRPPSASICGPLTTSYIALHS